MKFDGASTGVSSSGVKSSGFDYSFSFKDNDEEQKTKFDNFPGGIFTMPGGNNVAFNHSTGGRDDGAAQWRNSNENRNLIG